MARDKSILLLRTTRANLDTQKNASGLLVGELYYITDEGKVVIGSAVNAYTDPSDLVKDTTPQLGGDLDLNGKNIAHTAILSTNGTYQGEILTVTVDTNAVGFGAALAQAADFHFDEADADAIATAYMVVLACETGTGTKKVLLKGQICNTGWSWSAGPVYLSITQGTLTQTLVSGVDDVNLWVGFALSATCIYFNPYLYVAERTA